MRHKLFESGNLFKDIKSTWNGDEFCAKLMGKKVSGPLFYNYSMIRKGAPATISTFKISAEFNSKEFKTNPYSDHDDLWSLIRWKL